MNNLTHVLRWHHVMAGPRELASRHRRASSRDPEPARLAEPNGGGDIGVVSVAGATAAGLLIGESTRAIAGVFGVVGVVGIAVTVAAAILPLVALRRLPLVEVFSEAEVLTASDL
jgi:hypothetical protein